MLRTLLVLLGASGPLVGIGATRAAATNTIGGDKAKAAQIEARLVQLGERAQSVVARSNAVAHTLAVIDAGIRSDQATLAADRKSVDQAAVRLRRSAIAAYVDDASGNSPALVPIAGIANASSLADQQTYLGIASGNIDGAVTTLQIDEYRIAATERDLEQKQAETTTTLRQLNDARAAADAAINAQDAVLQSTNESLLALVDAANERSEEAEDEEAEQQLAQRAEQSTVADPPAPPAHARSGTYANPLRGVAGLSPERIDQGVDYSGYGPIFAVGDGVVISTYNSGWPGGTFISYRLTDGPAAGLVVYAAEDINPTVSIGEQVNSNTVLGQIYEGPDGIETGWTDGRGDGTTMAADYGQYGGGNSTAFGANFSALLVSLGAPGGQLQNNPPTGSLPGGWPQW